MAATQVKREQVRDGLVNNSKVSPSAGITYSKLALTNSLIGGDLTSGAKQTVLESKLDGYFDKIENFTTTSGVNSDNVTTEVESAATTLAHTRDGSSEGILTSGDSSAEWGLGSQNYTCLMRLHSSYDPIDDGENGQVTAYFSHENFFSLTGTITFNTGSATVTGSSGTGGTLFTTQLEAGSVLVRVDTEEVIGTVQTITNDTSLTLTANAAYSGTDKNFARTKTKGTVTVSQGGTSVSSTGTILNTDFEAGDALVNPATGNTVGYIADTTGRTDTSMELTSAATEALNGVNAQKREYKLYYHQQDGDAYTFTQATAIDFLFIEVFNEYSKPLLASATGYGFTDVVGVTGTHNHDDRYYTKTQIGSVTDSSSGADLIGFTPLATSGWNTSNTVQSAVEGMVSDLSDTTTSSSGATLIGVEAIGNLSSTDVQAAFEELQGDIDTINGSLGSGSLDAAYNNGSTITVDTTDVDWDLSDNRTWMVSGPGTGNPILEVKAVATGDEVNVVADKSTWTISNVAADSFKLDTLGGIDIDTDGGFTLDDDSGASFQMQSSGTIFFEPTSNQDFHVQTLGTSTILLDSNNDVIIQADLAASDAIRLNAVNGGIDIDYSNSYDFNVQGGTVTFSPQDTGASSFKIDTLGGVDIDVDAGINIAENSGASIAMNTSGQMDLQGATDQSVTLSAQGTGNVKVLSATGTAYLQSTGNATANAVTLDAQQGGIKLDATTGIGIDTTAGPIGITAAGSGGAITLTAQADEDITLDTSGTGEVVIDGDFRVTGTQTIVNTETIELADNIIVLNSNYTGGSPSEDSGIEVERGSQSNVSLFWDESTDRWRFQDLTGTYDILKASEASTTLDSAYDSETGNRIITMDTGSVEWQITSGYQHAFADSVGNDILSVEVSASGSTVDIDTTNGFTVNDDSGAQIAIANTGAVAVIGGNDHTVTLESTGSGTIQLKAINGGVWIINNNSTATDAIKINASTGGIDIDASQGITLDENGGSYLHIGNTGAIDLSSTNNTLTIQTAGTTPGHLILRATAASDNYAMDINSSGGIDVDAANNIAFTTSGGDITFDDQYLSSAIPISESGTTGLALGFTATSVVAALNEVKSDVLAASSTLDEAYDSETGNRIITMDNGSVEWQMTDNYEHNFADSLGNDILSVKALASGDEIQMNVDVLNINVSNNEVDINTTAGFRIDDDSGSYFQMHSGGNINAVSPSNVLLQSQLNVDIQRLSTAAGGNIDIDSRSPDADAILLDAVNGGIDVNADDTMDIDVGIFDLYTDDLSASSVKIDTLGGIDLDVDAGFTLNDNSGGNFQLQTSGKIFFEPASGQDFQVQVPGAGNVNLETTTGTAKIFSVSGGKVELSTNNTSATAIVIAATNTGGGIDIDSDTDTSITSANGDITFDDQYLSSAIPISESGTTGLALGFTSTSIVGAINELKTAGAASTLDEAYDGETGNKIITVDSGSVEWQLTDNYEFNVADSLGADVFSVKALVTGDEIHMDAYAVDIVLTGNTATDSWKLDTAGGIDIDVDSGINIAENSGASMAMNAAGQIDLQGATDQNVTLTTQGTGDATISSVNGRSYIKNTTSAAADAVKIEASTGGIDIDSADGITFNDDSGSKLLFDASGYITMTSGIGQNIDITGFSGSVKLSSTADTKKVWLQSTNATQIDSVVLQSASGGVRVLATAATYGIFTVDADRVDINANNGITIDENSGANFTITNTGAVSLTTASNSALTLGTSGSGTATISATSGQIYLNNTTNTNNDAIWVRAQQGGATIDVAKEVVVQSSSGGITLTAASDNDITLDTSGTGQVLIDGDLTVTGTQTIVNTETIELADNLIVLNSNYTGGSPTEDSGIEIERGSQSNVSLFWDESADRWRFQDLTGTYDILKASEASTTLDSAYDSETGNRIVTMDTGSVEWQITDNYEHNFADSLGNDLFSIRPLVAGDQIVANGDLFDINSASVDIDTTNGFTVDDDSGAFLRIQSSGLVQFYSASGQSMTINASSASLSMQGDYADMSGNIGGDTANAVRLVAGNSTNAAAVRIETTSGGIDIDAGNGITLDDDSGAYVHIASGGAIEINSDDQPATFQTSGGTPGILTISGGATNLNAVDINAAAGGVDIDADNNIALTSANGDVTFDDQYLSSAIPISESGTTGLTAGFTATSVVAALNEVKSDVLAASSTLDEAYDSETGNRIVTMDNGSVEWQMTDNYEFNVADSLGSDILSIKALGAGDTVDVTGNLTVTGEAAFKDMSGTAFLSQFTTFQSALDYLNSNYSGGTLYVDVDNFDLTPEIASAGSAVILYSNITIQGFKGRATRIKSDNTTYRHFEGTDLGNIKFIDLRIIGPGQGQVGGGGIFLTRAGNTNIPHIYMENILLEECAGDGISINTPILSTFINVKTLKCAGHGFNVWGGTSCNFRDCYGITNTQAGFALTNMTYSSLSGCASEACGISYDIVTSNNITLDGCGSESTVNRSGSYPGYAYKITGTQVTLNGCYATASADNAVQIDTGADNTTLIGFRSLSTSGSYALDNSNGGSTTLIECSFDKANNLNSNTKTIESDTIAGSGELKFDDSRTSAIAFSDVSNSSFDDGISTSVIGAINQAYGQAAVTETLDEIYDAETGNRIVTMDNGSVEWQITSGYQHAFADAAGNDILSVEVSGSGNAIDMNVTNGLTIDEDSGAYIHMAPYGAVNINSIGGDATWQTSDSNLTIQTAGGTAGKLTLASGQSSIDAIDINSSGGIDVDAAGDIAFTTSSGDITFDDQYLSSAIPISESGTTGLTAGFTATSIIGAINEAFQTAVEIGYEEQTPDASEASGDYITLTDASLTNQLPTSSKTATELRTSELYVAVYLNGLRLLDTEWSYGYVSTEKRIEFDGTGSSAVDLDTSDDVIVELVKTSA